MIKIFLDDVRSPPDDTWQIFRSPTPEFYQACATADIISLDHDLGQDIPTGYDVVKHFEEAIFMKGLWARNGAPTIHIHSANPVGRQNMQACLESIYRMVDVKKMNN